MKYSNDLDKVSYCLGLSIASNLISSGVDTINAEAFNDAMSTVFAGKMPEIIPDEANKILQDYFDKLQNKKDIKNHRNKMKHQAQPNIIKQKEYY